VAPSNPCAPWPRVSSARELEALQISPSDGRRVRLDEVAVIKDTVAEPRSAALLNGQPVVGFEVRTQPKALSETEVGAGVRKALDDLRLQPPRHVDADRGL